MRFEHIPPSIAIILKTSCYAHVSVPSELDLKSTQQSSHSTPTMGLEPMTTRLRALRSTNLARSALYCIFIKHK